MKFQERLLIVLVFTILVLFSFVLLTNAEHSKC